MTEQAKSDNESRTVVPFYERPLVQMFNIPLGNGIPFGIERISNQQRIEFDGRFDEVPGIFSMMDPKDGAIESFNELAKHFDTYILSTAPWENQTAWSDKLNWVKKYLGAPAHKRLILSHHKNLS